MSVSIHFEYLGNWMCSHDVNMALRLSQKQIVQDFWQNICIIGGDMDVLCKVYILFFLATNPLFQNSIQ